MNTIQAAQVTPQSILKPETNLNASRPMEMFCLFGSTMNIKPVMSAEEGVIIQRGQGIGTKKALMKMVDIIAKETSDVEKKRLMITHVNCYERAMTVRDMILTRCSFREAVIVDAAGVATVYAGDGGIVVTC